MKILDRYTLKAYLAPLVWCFGVFIGLYLVLDLFGHLDEILRNKVSLALLLSYYGTMVPLIFIQVAPFACLMASLYTLSQFNRHLEVMAMRAAGVSPWSIIRPLVWMGLFLSLTVLVINETVAPGAALTTHQIKQNSLERPGNAARPSKLTHPAPGRAKGATDAGDGVRDKPALTDRAGMEFRANSKEREREGESELPRRGNERPAVPHPDPAAGAPEAAGPAGGANEPAHGRGEACHWRAVLQSRMPPTMRKTPLPSQRAGAGDMAPFSASVCPSTRNR